MSESNKREQRFGDFHTPKKVEHAATFPTPEKDKKTPKPHPGAK